MALTDDMTKLADRANEAKDRAGAAREQANADLEQQMASVRASAQEQSDRLRQTAQEGQGRISSGWTHVQRSWNDHVDKLRADIDSRKAEHDVHMAQVKADHAEEDARFAVDFAGRRGRHPHVAGERDLLGDAVRTAAAPERLGRQVVDARGDADRGEGSGGCAPAAESRAQPTRV